jgi:phospholipid/cholesterol/gamma-HCH transport system substrate-binding protein
MNNNIIEAIAGIIVLFVAALFIVIAYDASKITVMDDPYYMIKANFERIDGIDTGSVIKLGGVDIGRVASTKLDQTTYRAVVEMFISKSIKLPADSSAEITSSGFLGDKYISITPGAEENMLEENQEISLTQSSISLEALLGKFIFSNANKAS